MSRTGGLWPPRGAARVLIVSDDPLVLTAAARALANGPHATRAVSDGPRAAAAIGRWRPHAVVADIDMVGLDLLGGGDPPGSARPPVIALTRRTDLPGRLTAFEAGADDVLAVPLEPAELRARLRALLRRAYTEATPFSAPLRVGAIEVDVLNRTVRANGLPVRMTPLELSLLYLLVSHAGRPVTRDQILDTLWGVDSVPSSNVVDRLVRSLRQRLGDDCRQPRFVATVRGRGYQLLAQAPGAVTGVGGRERPWRTAS
jgi:DNA-binding response OmpR family regulator